ncbi:MAG: hypothetical protein JO307_18080, partial [Bryobacterales bacterium]|nr:hypothetical protein [Bryobacterales bacterium]
KTIAAEFGFWSKTVRPMGAIYYLPLYGLFGLNPWPFNLVRSLILLLNTVIFFFLAKEIARSSWVALLASFPVAYQANIGNLHYDGAYIYDVLCGAFYFAALLYYVSRRQKVGPLHARQICVFLVLYICALDSKEMAVSLPVIVLAYEVLFVKRKARFTPVLVAGAVTLIFILGKTTGQGALTALESYKPIYTWQRFSESSTRILNQMFYTGVFTIGRVLELWAVLLYIGLRNWGRRNFDPRWLFFFIWVVVTPLPLVFLPGRGGATLYVVSAGWAMLAALAARAIFHWFARQPVAGLPKRAIMTAGLAACIAAYWHETLRAEDKLTAFLTKNGEDTREAIAQMQALGAHPPPHSLVVFLNGPFPHDYDTVFIAALVWREPTVNIWFKPKQPPGDDVLKRANYIFDYVDGRFVELRSPHAVRPALP